MGFPVGYTELLLPKLLLHTLSLLGLIRKLISIFFHLLGLPDFHQPDIVSPDSSSLPDSRFHSVSALLVREILPVVSFSELLDPPESCAVCLYEFEDQDQIRRLTNCRHIFHQSCLDRWMAYHQMTCPLCRAPFIPDELQEAFNERLWAASGIPDFVAEDSHVPGL
ncbi:E3 ubiquitin-protein ligase RHA1B-like [Carica papaya]|uniref:E3 ubiquitin-protein ligase RHA1B-like n=1 Tax=Carica papaya TaxID=3649 RepID=UPI000B8CBA9B|nr:E3 ubiquitin-protein ligase RHA1B-like [Carica papaya]